MFSHFRIVLISTIISTFSFADVFMTEITDPQDSSDAGRYVELYNNGDSDVILGDGSAGSWALQRWTNGNPLDAQDEWKNKIFLDIKNIKNFSLFRPWYAFDEKYTNK